MKRKFFIKNLILFLFPLLITVIILGTLSIIITQQNIQGEINKNNLILFNQIDRNIELIFNEMDSLRISIGDSGVLYRLEEILLTQALTLENLRLMEHTQNYINAPANARPYIESIYVYLNNPNEQFLSSIQGLTKFTEFYDTDWKMSYEKNQHQRDVWTESREIQRYSFENPTPVTTVYKNLYSALHDKPRGIIVLNVYTEYIEKLLRDIESSSDQYILILNENNEVIFKNRTLDEINSNSFNDVLFTDSSFALEEQDTTYMGSHLFSDKYGWRFVSIVPEKTLNTIPSRLSAITLFFVCFSFILGLILTYFLTKRTVNHVHNIINILKSAEKNLPMPQAIATKKDDEYDYIIQNIIRNFIEQNYLKVQLSEKKYKLQAAELLALQSQMNPHFLFNTMETINWKALSLTGKPNEVNRMIERLSDLLKYSMDNQKRIVPFEKEIKNTQNYIDIQKVRYRDKFDVDWEYDEEINPYGVIKLLLQPLIENSIYHGIKEKEGKSHIKIKIWRFDAFIRISVIDNGIGMTKDRLKEVKNNLQQESEDYGSGHIGLYNTHKILMLTYGSAYGIKILSKLSWGTVVSIRIPI